MLSGTQWAARSRKGWTESAERTGSSGEFCCVMRLNVFVTYGTSPLTLTLSTFCKHETQDCDIWVSGTTGTTRQTSQLMHGSTFSHAHRLLTLICLRAVSLVLSNICKHNCCNTAHRSFCYYNDCVDQSQSISSDSDGLNTGKCFFSVQ